MSYAADTVLVRSTPQGDPMDRIRVVGPSPIKGVRSSEWAGETGSNVIVNAVDEFAPPREIPESFLNREYEIESEPDTFEQVIDPRRRPRVATMSPEESLRRQAADKEVPDAKPKAPRGRTAIKGEPA